MSRNAIAIAQEFLRSSDAQVRRNAVTALAVIDLEDSIAELVKVALGDADPSVRKHAEDELIQLTGDSAVRATKRLYTALDDKQMQMPAYALLGRLRGRGFPVTMPAQGLVSRFRLAWAMHSYLHPTPDWTFRLRALAPALLGGILGALLFILFLMMALEPGESSGSFVAILILGGLLSLTIGTAVTQRSSSVNLHLDRVAAVLVEVSNVALWGFLPAVLFTLLYFQAETSRPNVALFVITILEIIAFTAAVRAGTLIASGSFAHRRWNTFAQVAVGVASGFVAGTTFLIIAGVVHQGVVPVGIWAILLPAGVGIAIAFATIDMEFVPAGLIAGRAARPLSLILILALAVPAVLAVVPTIRASLPDFRRRELPIAEQGGTLLQRIPITSSTQSVSFKVEFPQRIQAMILESSYDKHPEPWLIEQVRLYADWNRLDEEYYRLLGARRLTPSDENRLKEVQGRWERLRGPLEIDPVSQDELSLMGRNSSSRGIIRKTKGFIDEEVDPGEFSIKVDGPLPQVTLQEILPLLIRQVTQVITRGPADGAPVASRILVLILNSDVEKK